MTLVRQASGPKLGKPEPGGVAAGGVPCGSAVGAAEDIDATPESIASRNGEPSGIYNFRKYFKAVLKPTVYWLTTTDEYCKSLNLKVNLSASLCIVVSSCPRRAPSIRHALPLSLLGVARARRLLLLSVAVHHVDP